MKKLSLLIVLIFAVFQILSAEDAEAYKGTRGLEYSFNEESKTAFLTGRGTAQEGQIIVPQLVKQNGENYRVMQVESGAFYRDLKLTSIILPEGLNYIGPGAFDSCVNLSQCVLPSTIYRIYDFAFYNCKNLKNIHIPDSLGFTGKCSFEGTGITTPLYNDICFMYMPPSFKGRYAIAEGTKNIGVGAFANCANLYGITIPESVTWIGDWAFWSCQKLSEVVIPNDSILYLGEGSFASCSSLRSVKLPAGLVEIPSGLCQDCINLRNISIPQSVISIGAHAFSRCEQLLDISLPDKLESIGDWAFARCENLNQIILPKSVRFVGNGAFDECYKFTTPVFNDSVFAYMPASFKGKHYTINNGIKQIAGWAFIQCENLESLSVPNSVEEAGECSVIGGILDKPVYNQNIFLFLPPDYIGRYVIPDGIKTIASRACAFCEKLTNVIIPNSVTEIASGAFEECYSLKRVEIPNKDIIKVADDAFPSNCTIVWK